MNSGYEGSLPEALGNRIVIITFFIANVVSFFSIAVKAMFSREGKKYIQGKRWVGLVDTVIVHQTN